MFKEKTLLSVVGGTDKDGHRKERLLDIFGEWTDMVTDLIRFASWTVQ